jgi:hypothetical protein
MALINTGPNYTRTGDSMFTRFANKVSMLPFGGLLAWPIGQIGTFIEAGSWLLRGKIGSAATAFAAGTISNTVNAAVSSNPFTAPIWYVGQLGSGVASGTSLGTHTRALSESAIGAVTGALGFKPTVLQSYTAGVGSIGGGAARSGPGYYATRAAQERGADPQAMWNQYRSGAGADHVSALEAARAQGQAQRGL